MNLYMGFIDMKRLSLLFLFCCTMSFSFGQQRLYYCEILSTPKAFGGLDIVFDIGDDNPYGKVKSLNTELSLVDGNGKIIEFNSIVDAANYMADYGWEFKQSYTSICNVTDNSITHWIFCKKADSLEQAKGGIDTWQDYRRRNIR